MTSEPPAVAWGRLWAAKPRAVLFNDGIDEAEVSGRNRKADDLLPRIVFMEDK